MIRFAAAGAGHRYPPLRPAAAGVVAALVLVPLGYVVAAAVATGPAAAADLLWRPRVGELLTNTVVLVVLGTVACAVLGVGAAWLVERTDLPGRPLWTGLMAAPLAVPAFVSGVTWTSLSPGFAGLGAAVTVTSLSYFPLVYLPVSAVLRGIDPADEEAARALGCGPWTAFTRVVLPQVRPALAGGCLLVGLHLLAEFGALQALRYDTFTTAVYDRFQSSFDGTAATMLALVLVALCLVLLGIEPLAAGRARTSRVGRGSARPPLRHPLGGARVLAVGALLAVAAGSVGVPLWGIGLWFATSNSTAFPADELAAATVSTLGLGVLGAVVTTALAFPVAWLVVRRSGPLARVVERCSYVGSSLPGVVVALALVTVAIRAVPAVYQTVVTLVAAYAILFLPRAVVSLRAALGQLPPAFEDVGASLGVSPRGVTLRITLPLVVRGLGAGTALVFLAVVTELTSTLLLAPTGTATLATRFWSASTEIHYGAAAPYALLMILLSAPAAWLLTRRSRAAGALA